MRKYVSRYKKVAKFMKSQPKEMFFKTYVIAEALNMERHSVVCSMSSVRDTLADEGLVLVNKKGYGYAVSDEAILLEKEARKAVLRGNSYFKRAWKITDRLQVSGMEDLESTKAWLTSVLDAIQGKVREPDDIADPVMAIGKPKWVDEVAGENVGDDDFDAEH
jgi:hypothetical protein